MFSSPVHSDRYCEGKSTGCHYDFLKKSVIRAKPLNSTLLSCEARHGMFSFNRH